GAVALVGANYQIGVKFTTEPGKQFLIRRKALIGIQKAFAENGIEMAAPRVVVESQDPDQVAAAATKALSNQQQAVSAEGAPPGEQA
ncbi:MAG: mechanosensitive ion channel family protein, partial [Pseudomonadota bacterium]